MQENHWANLSMTTQLLLIYGALMWLACGVSYWRSLHDARTIRDVGIWVKPMKFMASTALFVWTTVWLTEIANSTLSHEVVYSYVGVLIILTSLFEVAYITFQAANGKASHYNTHDSWSAFMFGLMGIAAIALTASQAWLAWELWKTTESLQRSVTLWGVIIGLNLTFVLSTISGLMLGGSQPPAGQGLPIVGWHLGKDLRPAHFLGVHAQQLIPLWGIVSDLYFGAYSMLALIVGCISYLALWVYLGIVNKRDI